ncbi:hypothetical protein ACSBR1_043283 [Camellia fascicularis]
MTELFVKSLWPEELVGFMAIDAEGSAGGLLLAWEEKELRKLKEELGSGPSLCLEILDNIRWNADCSGCFNVKSVFNWCEQLTGSRQRLSDNQTRQQRKDVKELRLLPHLMLHIICASLNGLHIVKLTFKGNLWAL